MNTVSHLPATGPGSEDARWITSLGAPCPEVVDLLRTIHDALDVPLPGLRPEDESAYHRVMEQRMNAVRCALQGLLAYPGRIDRSSAERIRARVAQSPVAYTAYAPEGRLIPA